MALSARFLFHKCPPLFPNLGQVNPVHLHLSCFFKISFNIVFPTVPSLPKSLSVINIFIKILIMADISVLFPRGKDARPNRVRNC
jgi:hypothetical protein